MNFIIELLKSNKYNVIFVIINKFIKKRHYILYIVIDEDIIMNNIVNIFIREIFRLYNFPIFIILDRESQFVIIM